MRILHTLDTAPLDVPLWGVYGPDCFPTVFACKVKFYPDGYMGSSLKAHRAVWGWSVYRRKGAYRTLGSGQEWADKHDLWLFTSRQDAFDYIASLFPSDARA